MVESETVKPMFTDLLDPLLGSMLASNNDLTCFSFAFTREDLIEVVGTMFKEMRELGLETPGCAVFFPDAAKNLMRVYSALENPRRYGIAWHSAKVQELDENIASAVVNDPMRSTPPLNQAGTRPSGSSSLECPFLSR